MWGKSRSREICYKTFVIQESNGDVLLQDGNSVHGKNWSHSVHNLKVESRRILDTDFQPPPCVLSTHLLCLVLPHTISHHPSHCNDAREVSSHVRCYHSTFLTYPMAFHIFHNMNFLTQLTRTFMIWHCPCPQPHLLLFLQEHPSLQSEDIKWLALPWTWPATSHMSACLQAHCSSF